MVKLFVIWRLLSLRRQHPEVFQDGDYVPLEAAGTRADHLVGFTRTDAASTRTLLVCVPRLLARIASSSAPYAAGDEVWADTFLAVPEGLAETAWRNVFTGETLEPAATYEDRQIPAASVLRTFPTAVFEPA
jgi:(1->4)-alpha-D-glucan 1-alpha-D-glucosylmutase